MYTFTPPKYREALGVLSLHPDLTPEFGFVIEVLITFQLIWTATASKDPIRKFTGFQAPFAIGMSVTIGLMTGVRFSLYHWHGIEINNRKLLKQHSAFLLCQMRNVCDECESSLRPKPWTTFPVELNLETSFNNFKGSCHGDPFTFCVNYGKVYKCLWILSNLITLTCSVVCICFSCSIIHVVC